MTSKETNAAPERYRNLYNAADGNSTLFKERNRNSGSKNKHGKDAFTLRFLIVCEEIPACASPVIDFGKSIDRYTQGNCIGLAPSGETHAEHAAARELPPMEAHGASSRYSQDGKNDASRPIFRGEPRSGCFVRHTTNSKNQEGKWRWWGKQCQQV